MTTADEADLIGAIAELLWPIIVVALLVAFGRPLWRLIDKASKFRLIGPGGFELEVTAQESAALAQRLLNQVDILLDDLDEEDRALMSRVVSKGSPLSVGELIPGFGRGSEEHNRLQKLRRCQLIRPKEGGQWKAEKHIEVKPFGRILLSIHPEKILKSR